jgi:hypothetical protein
LYHHLSGTHLGHVDRMYADIFKDDLNPIARLLGDSKTAIMIREMPTWVSTTECTCGYHDESFDDVFTECTCGLDDKRTRLKNERSMAVGKYIRTHEVCRGI